MVGTQLVVEQGDLTLWVHHLLFTRVLGFDAIARYLDCQDRFSFGLIRANVPYYNKFLSYIQCKKFSSIRFCIVSNFAWGTFYDNLSPFISTLWTEIYYPVTRGNDMKFVLDH